MTEETAGTHHSPLQDFTLVAGAATETEREQVLISGPLIEVGKLNHNEWGIAKEEVDNILRTLPNTPLKICSGAESLFNQHSCDYTWNPKAEIGITKSAELKDDGWIHAIAEVTDSEARKKVNEGTWPRKWSVFLTHKSPTGKGMLTGTQGRSITLVRDPAYEQANFKVGVGAGAGIETITTTGTGTAAPAPKHTPASLNEALQFMQSNPEMVTDDMKAIMRNMEPADAKAKGEHMAENDSKITQADLDKAVAAAIDKTRLEEQAKTTEALKDTDKLIAAAKEQAKADTIELLERTGLSEEIVKLQVSAGALQPEDSQGKLKEFMATPVPQLKEYLRLTQLVKGVREGAGAGAQDKFKDAKIPAKAGPGGAKSPWTVGRPIKGVWEAGL